MPRDTLRAMNTIASESHGVRNGYTSVDARSTTRRGGCSTTRGAAFASAMRSASISPALRPSEKGSVSMLESGGRAKVPRRTSLSTPSTATSPGTDTPAASQARASWNARMSLQQKTAIGFGSEAIQFPSERASGMRSVRSLRKNVSSSRADSSPAYAKHGLPERRTAATNASPRAAEKRGPAKPQNAHCSKRCSAKHAAAISAIASSSSRIVSNGERSTRPYVSMTGLPDFASAAAVASSITRTMSPSNRLIVFASTSSPGSMRSKRQSGFSSA